MRCGEAVDSMQTSQGLLHCQESEQSLDGSTIKSIAARTINEEQDDKIPNDSLKQPVLIETVISKMGSFGIYQIPQLSPTHLQPVACDQIEEGTSESDSDYDFECKNSAIKRSNGDLFLGRDIPKDGNLGDYQLKLVDTVAEDMDAEIEALLKESAHFVWDEDYSKFHVAPETFKGPAPGPIKDYDTPLEAFENIWDHSIMEHIVKEINTYAGQKIASMKNTGTLKSTSRLHKWTDTCVDEMYLYFGILIFMGLDIRVKNEYWETSDIFHLPKFRRLMDYDRFILLEKFLQFLDSSENDPNVPQNRSTVKIAPIIHHLNNKFSSLYNLHRDIAIDESLTRFKGLLPWLQSPQTKGQQSRIKSYELCEPTSGYLYKCDIYTGNNSDLSRKSIKIVLELLSGLEHRGHCVVMDNFFNSPALARYLKSSGFDCFGTLRPSRKYVPAEIASMPKNLPNFAIIARHSGDVSCVAWKNIHIFPRKVYMISTYHIANAYVERAQGIDCVIPVVVKDHCDTMKRIDRKYRKLPRYLIEKMWSEKWYTNILKRLVTRSVLNSFIMLNGSLERRGLTPWDDIDFRKELVECLVKKYDFPVRLRRDILHVPDYPDGEIQAVCHICKKSDTEVNIVLKCIDCYELLCIGECWANYHTLENLPGEEL